MRNRKLNEHLPLLWIALIPVLNIFYGVLNNGERTVRYLDTRVDEWIPFIPFWIVPYLLWYPFILIMLVVFFKQNKEAYYRVLTALCLGLIGCYIMFYFFQTGINRPAIEQSDWAHWLVGLVYATDGTYNCFPSIHVLTSYLMIRGTSLCASIGTTLRWVIALLSWSIIVSTVFVKQHVVLDIPGAIVLAELTLLLAGWLVTHWSARKQSALTRS